MCLSADLDSDGRAPDAAFTTKTEHMEACYAKSQINFTLIILKRESPGDPLVCYFLDVSWQLGVLNIR